MDRNVRATKAKATQVVLQVRQGVAQGGLWMRAPVAPVVAAAIIGQDGNAKREGKTKAKNDPKLVATARELRDRWLEQLQADPSALSPEASTT